MLQPWIGAPVRAGDFRPLNAAAQREQTDAGKEKRLGLISSATVLLVASIIAGGLHYR